MIIILNQNSFNSTLDYETASYLLLKSNVQNISYLNVTHIY